MEEKQTAAFRSSNFGHPGKLYVYPLLGCFGLSGFRGNERNSGLHYRKLFTIRASSIYTWMEAIQPVVKQRESLDFKED